MITRISFGKTFNTGNYESVRIDLTATVESDETEQDVYLQLREMVERLGAGEIERAKQNKHNI